MPTPSTRTTVYLDTSAWNGVLDAAGPLWRPDPDALELLFSSCDLDEFGAAEEAKAAELATFAWECSNRRKLLDHVELAAGEIAAHQLGEPLTEPYDEDPGFFLGWHMLRTGQTPPELREALVAQMKQIKRELLEHVREGRKFFAPFYRKAKELGLEYSWEEFVSDTDYQDQLREKLLEGIAVNGLLGIIPDPQAALSVPLWELPGTAASLQYYMAMLHVACHETGKWSRPDFGDQVDMRHATYAGIADVYVSGDDRMRWLLTDRVLDCRAEVLPPEKFLARFG